MTPQKIAEVAVAWGLILTYPDDETGEELAHIWVEELWPDDDEQMDDQYVLSMDELAELQRLTRLH